MADVAYIAAGSNLGDRESYLAFARDELSRMESCRLVGATVPEETAPFGPAGQSPYLNQMIALETELEPHDLLRALQAIELRAGRVRGERWGARTLDLDIVMFGERVSDDPALLLPHPGLRDRGFWQRELATLKASR